MLLAIDPTLTTGGRAEAHLPFGLGSERGGEAFGHQTPGPSRL